MLAAMERFLSAPLDSTPAEQGRIKAFASECHDVELVIDPAVVPFLTEELDPGAQSLLLTGFIAGWPAARAHGGPRARVRCYVRRR